jgi:hypothetical protein
VTHQRHADGRGDAQLLEPGSERRPQIMEANGLQLRVLEYSIPALLCVRKDGCILEGKNMIRFTRSASAAKPVDAEGLGISQRRN